MADLLHLSVEQVRLIHAAVLHAHGGSPGLRDEALLESAVTAPQAIYGGQPLFGDPVEAAGAYLFYLCRNHAFVDGNKRTALAACLVFLRINGLKPTPDSLEWETLVLDVAGSRLDREETTKRLKKLVRK
ncbi:MAG TPA: type II toxin-antitoxin system death-on-curing family toxin [Gammaproteobacteria bacterium]|jgi:death-on-curing protein|nr:type II toxin-antitoxin system death-on-curing family toxin [Gammaproteobacteria bacterium]